MKLQFPLLLFSCILFSAISIAQDDPGISFNHVKPADFSLEKITVDTSYGAVIVADIGKSYFEGNSKGWFTLVYEHKRRIRIIDKKAFDLATVEIPLYKSKTSDDEETLESLKAFTYNLENGKVVETKLDKDNVFKEKLDGNHSVKKFTMPAVKEGSIIEYSYKVNSDFLFNLQPWSFQGGYPRMWSEYKVAFPSFLQYVTLTQGYYPFFIKSNQEVRNSYSVRENGNGINNDGRLVHDDLITIPSTDLISRWVIRDIPAMKEEKFTSSLSNHISQIEFQLAGENFPGQPYKSIMGNWVTVSEELLKDNDFGADLTSANNWINSEASQITSNPANKTEEAKGIYKYVQHSMRSKGIRGIYLSQPLKETFKNKSGYVADINMLLTMILVNRGFDASPVLISTRKNGTASDLYPLISKFNYVICNLIINDKSYLLDASQPYLGFNKLPAYVYNGSARILGPNPTGIYLTTDSLTENKTTDVTLDLDEKNRQSWKGIVYSSPGYEESGSIREAVLEKGKEEYIKKIKLEYTGDYSINDVNIDQLDQNDEPVLINYNLNIENNKSDFIYFNPMTKEGMTENPFKSQERKYPVEMPFKINETYILRLQIPEGYVVDELPKSAKVKLNEDEALFEYIITKNDKEINLRTKLKFERANFLREDYEALRDFFDYIVKKHAEQIVFKKK